MEYLCKLFISWLRYTDTYIFGGKTGEKSAKRNELHFAVVYIDDGRVDLDDLFAGSDIFSFSEASANTGANSAYHNENQKDTSENKASYSLNKGDSGWYFFKLLRLSKALTYSQLSL